MLLVGVLLPTLASQGTGGTESVEGFSTGKTLGVILVMNTMTSAAGVYSNWLLAHHDLTIGFWHKSVYLYAFGAGLNIMGGYLQSEGQFSLTGCLHEWIYVYNASLWVVVITNVLGGLLVGMLLRRLGVLSQNIASCSIMFATALLQWAVLFIPPTTETLIGAGICAVAVSIYNDDVWAYINENIIMGKANSALSPPSPTTSISNV